MLACAALVVLGEIVVEFNNWHPGNLQTKPSILAPISVIPMVA